MPGIRAMVFLFNINACTLPELMLVAHSGKGNE